MIKLDSLLTSVRRDFNSSICFNFTSNRAFLRWFVACKKNRNSLVFFSSNQFRVMLISRNLSNKIEALKFRNFHSVKKWWILSHWKNISSNQLFSKNGTFVPQIVRVNFSNFHIVLYSNPVSKTYFFYSGIEDYFVKIYRIVVYTSISRNFSPN